ncbi:MAG: nuclear transport factor 2 family protein [Proteobacteria bacterium]|nr:nuclear transport factor 2 family protein [Pseudomonadota bacterium]
MDVLKRFLAYAAEFEKTLVDDDWSRLTPFFAEDAVYRVESDVFGCEIHGRDRILAGLKKSLDGFDRKFPGREMAATDGPSVDDDELSVGWAVTYRKESLPEFVLRGRSTARIRDGRISLLVDSYDEEVGKELAAWIEATGIPLDPAYV